MNFYEQASQASPSDTLPPFSASRAVPIYWRAEASAISVRPSFLVPLRVPAQLQRSAALHPCPSARPGVAGGRAAARGSPGLHKTNPARKAGDTLAAERANGRAPSACEGRSPLGFDLRTKGPCLVAAAVNPQGSDVTEGEGRHDRDERLLVELAFLGPSLHASVPNYLP
jgi:hypothetical protein